MKRIKSKDTSIEKMLRKALWRRGLRYRKNVKAIEGTPDIAFIGLKIAIFCDSEFWHGKNYFENSVLPKNNREYWREKFKKNAARDKKVSKSLEEKGWLVLRFWESDIRSDVDKIANEIEAVVKSRRVRKR